jgi:hypothetical protein
MKRFFWKLVCRLGYHRRLAWGHNLESDATEPRCRLCGRWVYADETPWLKDKRFR